MFRYLLVFEWKTQFRQLSFYLLLILTSVLGIASFVDVDNGIINGNSPYRLAFYISSLSTILFIPVLLFSIQSLLKESENRFEGILFSTSIDKSNYVSSRFLLVFLSSLAIGSLPIAGFYIAQFIEGSFYKTGTSHWEYFMWPWLVFTLPNTFLLTSFIFSSTLLSKSTTTSYIIASLLFIFFWIGSFYTNSPLVGGTVLSVPSIVRAFSILDFFGLAAFFEQTQYSTTFEKNNELFSLTGHLLINRVVWMTIASGITLWAFQRFSFRREDRIKKTNRISETTMPNKAYAACSSESGTILGMVRSFQSQVRMTLEGLMKSKALLILGLAWAVIISLGMHFIITGEAEYGSRIPTTDLLIGIISEPFGLFGMFLVIFSSGELYWRQRQTRFHEIIFSTPISPLSLYWANTCVMILLLFFMLTLAVAIGIVFQIISGHHFNDIAHYGSLYYYVGLPIVLIIFAAQFLQAVIPNKFIAMLITTGAVILYGPTAPLLGLDEFPLLRLLHIKPIDRYYSELSGYGRHARSFHAFLLYWSVFALALAIFSIKGWSRNITVTFRAPWKAISQPFQPDEKRLLSGVLLTFIAAGSYIFYNLYIMGPEAPFDSDLDFREAYERRFKSYESLLPPQIVEVKTEVDLYPEESRYEIRGNYELTNTMEAPIHEIFVSSRNPFSRLNIQNTTLIFHDEEMNAYLFKLNEPFMPGQFRTMTFEVSEQIEGFETSNAIMNNGSYISHGHFDPYLFYVDRLEIGDSIERVKRSLPYRKPTLQDDPHLSFEGKFSAQKVNYESVISTSGDQIALTSGRLVNHWNEDDRNFFHFKADEKVRRNMTYFSATYEVDTTNFAGISIELYYHQDHGHIIPLMTEITKKTLEYAIEQFGPYRHDHLRIAEVSSGRGFGGQAMPGVISMAEKSMYTKDVSSPTRGINVVARRTIHEIAHQWWAHQLSPKQVAGARVLTEGLCKYTEAVVLEKVYGPSMVRKLTENTIRQYFGRRAQSKKEPPLYLMDTQPYLAYSKGYMIFLGLKDVLGEETVNEALRNLIQAHGSAPTATTTDLINELYHVSPQQHHQLINDWLKRVITYDLKIAETKVHRLPDGRFSVDVNIEAVRREMLDNGSTVEIGIDEPIKIGIFRRHPGEMDQSDKPLYLQSHQIDSSQTSWTIITNDEPKYIAIDPYLTRLDRNGTNNIKFLDDR